MAQIPPREVSTSDKERLTQPGGGAQGRRLRAGRAIEQLVSAIKLSRAGLRAAEKPIGRFLLTGPTGVGKTEAAKQLAKVMGVAFHRFDMSEYMEAHTVSRLIGAPPGYVGFDQGGLLTDAIAKTPHAVLLLDEIEKAHPQIFNILLQVMDHGKLTDHNGKQTDFRHVDSAHDEQHRRARPAAAGGRLRRPRRRRTRQARRRPRVQAALQPRVPQPARREDRSSRALDARDHGAASSASSCASSASQLAERKVTIELTDAATDYLAEGGLRPGQRRPPARPRHAGRSEAPARRGAPLRRARERRPRRHRRREQGRRAKARVPVRSAAPSRRRSGRTERAAKPPSRQGKEEEETEKKPGDEKTQ